MKFHDVGGGEEIYASSDGHLEINAGNTIDMTTNTVDINATTAVTIDTPGVTITDSATNKPQLEIHNTNVDTNGPILLLNNANGTTAGSAGDVCGTINFNANDSQVSADNQNFVSIIGTATATTTTSEQGTLTIGVACTDDGGVDTVLTIAGGVNAAGSTTTVAGALNVTGPIISTGDLTVTGSDIVLGNGAAGTLKNEASAHNADGRGLTISAGSTTGGSSNDQPGGDLTLQGGQGKGNEAGGNIIFEVANAGSSGSSLNAYGIALTISDDSSATFGGNLKLIDDKTLILGSNDDIQISYDETTRDSLLISQSVNNTALSIVLQADAGQDAGDEWKLNVADGGTVTFGNDIASAGTYVTHLTIIPNATAANSVLAVAGNLQVGGNITITDQKDIVLDTNNGTKIGTAANQKLGFFGASPVDQRDSIADLGGGENPAAKVNAIILVLRNLGLIA